ncbi:hypothetical protein [Zestomonas carbonaria]|uniref:hypothetical protein n=1 Tax=Zestomonas carbonaria TaxID=2762745 RepID=UPI00165725D3|nr:hypothetical protein [Pseudomonas carbonaria]
MSTSGRVFSLHNAEHASEYKSSAHLLLILKNLLLVLLITSTQAMADSFVSAIDLGGTPCPLLKKATRLNLLHDSTIWLEGFLSAQHPEISEWNDLVHKKFDRSQKEAFVIAFCRKYPEATLRDAAISLLDFIEYERGYRPRRL